LPLAACRLPLATDPKTLQWQAFGPALVPSAVVGTETAAAAMVAALVPALATSGQATLWIQATRRCCCHMPLPMLNLYRASPGRQGPALFCRRRGGRPRMTDSCPQTSVCIFHSRVGLVALLLEQVRRCLQHSDDGCATILAESRRSSPEPAQWQQGNKWRANAENCGMVYLRWND
jgi:hypothetical protein